MKRSASLTRKTPLARGDGDRPGVQRVCQECGREFTATRDCATHTSKYCSRECGWAVQKRAAAEALPPAEELHRLHHEQGLSIGAIGRHYGRSAWWAKKALAMRDVPERKPSRTGRTVTCDFCGREFYAKASELKRGRRFCSHACRGQGMPAPSKDPEARRKISAAKMGAGNAMFKDGESEKTIYRVFNVRLKGEVCCRNCGSPRHLHLHHIVPRSMCKAAIRDLRNGVTLCAACHLAWHHRRFPIYRDILTSQEWAYVSSLTLVGQRIDAWLDDRYPARPAAEEAA